MEKIYRVSSWWCRLVLPFVNGPEGWGYGPSSEILPGFGHHLARVSQILLGAVLLFDLASWLRNYSFCRMPEGRKIEQMRQSIRNRYRY